MEDLTQNSQMADFFQKNFFKSNFFSELAE